MARPSSHPAKALRGRRTTGRIATILTGLGHGFIRSSDARTVYFHRADLQEGTSFGSLRIGDAVTFELFDDTVSGARALRLRKLARSAERGNS
jgi:cold shock CspA family protein